MERLEERGPERDWGKLVRTLEDLVQDSGRAIIQAAGDRGIQRLSEELLAIVLRIAMPFCAQSKNPSNALQ